METVLAPQQPAVGEHDLAIAAGQVAGPDGVQEAGHDPRAVVRGHRRRQRGVRQLAAGGQGGVEAGCFQVEVAGASVLAEQPVVLGGCQHRRADRADAARDTALARPHLPARLPARAVRALPRVGTRGGGRRGVGGRRPVARQVRQPAGVAGGQSRPGQVRLGRRRSRAQEQRQPDADGQPCPQTDHPVLAPRPGPVKGSAGPRSASDMPGPASPGRAPGGSCPGPAERCEVGGTVNSA